MNPATQIFLRALSLIVLGYLCGAIPFGLLVALLKGIDIRTAGSGNIGATNVGRVLGRPYGLLVFALDLLKGLLPTLLAGAFIDFIQHSDTPMDKPLACLFWVSVAAACILGHMFPVYLRFKGGKGVATSLGVLLGIYPYFTLAVLMAFGLWIVIALTTRYVSVASVTAAMSVPIIFALMAHLRQKTWGPEEDLWPLYLFGVVVGGLVVYRHRSNLKRLAAGVEPRIGSRR